ncbi:unnamed protein product, partial [Adineta ricciae]
MPEIIETDTSFDDIDTNRDGKIDKNEFQNWIANNAEKSSSTYETLTSGVYLHNSDDRRSDHRKYEVSESTIYSTDYDIKRLGRNRYTTRETIAVASGLTNESTIETHSLEETNSYLERAVDVYKDPNPLVIRKTLVDRPVTYEQRVLVRYLRPPSVR